MRGLIRAAVPAIELTMTVPHAVASSREFAAPPGRAGRARRSERERCWTRLSARPAPTPGRGFIVSPVTDVAVLGRRTPRGVPYVGGALTPTEVLASMRAGADAIKLFPVGSVGGAAYLRALREPLPGLRAVVSGGIAADEVRRLSRGRGARRLPGRGADRPGGGPAR